MAITSTSRTALVPDTRRAPSRQVAARAQLPPAHPPPASIFVSYAREDQGFVKFLVEMLRVHRLQAWHDIERVTPQRGKPRVMDHVRAGIRDSDAMVVVASPSTVESDWVRDELDTFIQDKADPFVIPAVIAPCDLSRIRPGLQDRVCLEFHRDMLEAFQALTKCFGSDWLPLIDQRSPRAERRNAPSHERLEFALCQIVRQRGLHLTQALPFGDQHRLLLELLEAFQVALQQSYRLVDLGRGTEVVVTAHAFRDAMLRAIEGRTLEHLVPAFLVKAVVGELGLRFRIEARDRRRGGG